MDKRHGSRVRPTICHVLDDTRIFVKRRKWCGRSEEDVSTALLSDWHCLQNGGADTARGVLRDLVGYNHQFFKTTMYFVLAVDAAFQQLNKDVYVSISVCCYVLELCHKHKLWRNCMTCDWYSCCFEIGMLFWVTGDCVYERRRCVVFPILPDILIKRNNI